MCLIIEMIYLKGKNQKHYNYKAKGFCIIKLYFLSLQILQIKKKDALEHHCSLNPKDLLVLNSRLSLIIECLNS